MSELCECGHTKAVHKDADMWWSEGMEDEIWTNDGCLTCGRFFDFDIFRCMHFKPRK